MPSSFDADLYIPAPAARTAGNAQKAGMRTMPV
jgi:hypothetical protein